MGVGAGVKGSQALGDGREQGATRQRWLVAAGKAASPAERAEGRHGGGGSILRLAKKMLVTVIVILIAIVIGSTPV